MLCPNEIPFTNTGRGPVWVCQSLLYCAEISVLCFSKRDPNFHPEPPIPPTPLPGHMVQTVWSTLLTQQLACDPSLIKHPVSLYSLLLTRGEFLSWSQINLNEGILAWTALGFNLERGRSGMFETASIRNRPVFSGIPLIPGFCSQENPRGRMEVTPGREGG